MQETNAVAVRGSQSGDALREGAVSLAGENQVQRRALEVPLVRVEQYVEPLLVAIQAPDERERRLLFQLELAEQRAPPRRAASASRSGPRAPRPRWPSATGTRAC